MIWYIIKHKILHNPVYMLRNPLDVLSLPVLRICLVQTIFLQSYPWGFKRKVNYLWPNKSQLHRYYITLWNCLDLLFLSLIKAQPLYNTTSGQFYLWYRFSRIFESFFRRQFRPAWDCLKFRIPKYWKTIYTVRSK